MDDIAYNELEDVADCWLLPPNIDDNSQPAPPSAAAQENAKREDVLVPNALVAP